MCENITSMSFRENNNGGSKWAYTVTDIQQKRDPTIAEQKLGNKMEGDTEESRIAIKLKQIKRHKSQVDKQKSLKKN